MKIQEITKIIQDNPNKTFLSVNFGCRVNAAEVNLLSQILVDSGFIPVKENPGVILINTCSITKKGDVESIGKARNLHQQFPESQIFVTGCANLKKLNNIENIYVFDNKEKEEILEELNCAYTPKIGDKFTSTKKFLLKIQSGCTQFCSYCTVPYKRQYLWSLPIEKAINTVNQAIENGYEELIVTGVNLDQYSYGFSNLLEAILSQTSIKKISFGSIPVGCISDQFINLFNQFPGRISSFLHVPIQSGSDNILKLMKRPYTKEAVLKAFSLCQQHIPEVEFGTDIIVGFPGEEDTDFQETYNLCQQIGFKKIHTFRFSPRPNTLARFYFDKYKKIEKSKTQERSQKIRALVS